MIPSCLPTNHSPKIVSISLNHPSNPTLNSDSKTHSLVPKNVNTCESSQPITGENVFPWTAEDDKELNGLFIKKHFSHIIHSSIPSAANEEPIKNEKIVELTQEIVNENIKQLFEQWSNEKNSDIE